MIVERVAYKWPYTGLLTVEWSLSPPISLASHLTGLSRDSHARELHEVAHGLLKVVAFRRIVGPRVSHCAVVLVVVIITGLLHD